MKRTPNLFCMFVLAIVASYILGHVVWAIVRRLM